VAGICPSNILLSYIEQVLKAGAAGKMDVLSFHPYGLTSPDVRGINRELRALQDLVAKYSPEGALPKLWATEIGYRSSDRPMNNPQRYPGIKLFSEAEVARFMVKMNLMLLDGGVERMYWFHLPGVGGLPNPYYYGFAYENPEHAVPKKQVAAFCQMTRALAGISMQGRVNAGDDELYLYRFAGGTAGDLKERWVLFRNERSNERHVSFIRSETPLVCQAVDGVPQPVAGRIGDVSIIEAGLAPGYVFNPSDRPGEILVPVSVEDVPEQMLDDSQIHLNVMCRNIFDRPMTVWVRPQLPQGWQSDLGQLSVPLSAGESRAVPLSIAVPASGGGAGSTPELRFEVQMPEIMEEPYILTRQTRLQLRRYVGLKSRTIGAASLQWTPASPGKNWTVKNDGGVVRTSYVFDDTHNIRQVWGAVRAPFEQPQDLGGYRQIKLEMKFSDPSEFMLSIMLTDPSGALYRAVADVDVAVRDQWQTVTVNLDEFRTIGSSGVQDDNGKLDLDRIRGIGLLGNSHRSATGTFEVRSITLEP
jgi:hypothetical protein